MTSACVTKNIHFSFYSIQFSDVIPFFIVLDLRTKCSHLSTKPKKYDISKWCSNFCFCYKIDYCLPGRLILTNCKNYYTFTYNYTSVHEYFITIIILNKNLYDWLCFLTCFLCNCCCGRQEILFYPGYLVSSRVAEMMSCDFRRTRESHVWG